jgi:hypothetical protein
MERVFVGRSTSLLYLINFKAILFRKDKLRTALMLIESAKDYFSSLPDPNFDGYFDDCREILEENNVDPQAMLDLMSVSIENLRQKFQTEHEIIQLGGMDVSFRL